MQNDAATIQCPNDLCKAPNRQMDKFCQRCGTPLIKRYLWAVGERIEACKQGDIVGARYFLIGDLVAERYLLKSNRIFLDTRPGLAPETLADIPNAIKPYLRLVTYRLHVPQVHGFVTLGKGHTTEILLLEQAPIYTDAVPLEGQLMPELTAAWKDATSMRQLNWLWQIATLWQPLSAEGAASSLLAPQLLRVEGSLVRLLELRSDRTCTPTLPELGKLWKTQLLGGAQRVIADFLEQLCQHLIHEEIRSSQQLVAILDRQLAEVGRSQSRTLRIGTYSDAGPSRQGNEDACYPPSGTMIAYPPAQSALTVVCDGIGGHEGGSIASNLAIETIQQQVQQIPLDDPHLDPKTLIEDLEGSACIANNRISERNDNEHRHGRQRMGTTLVMALARAHEIYITHIGDSRAYWITRTGCHQVTLDDDVASREVRLGYATYGDALQQASSGSLVQALGMSSSASLHPTVQQFVLDEDCVFLLCSDGLSDYDRVEQCWETEILPVLDGKVDVANAVTRLVEIANTQNGHDNVTVGLVYCQIGFIEPESTVSASFPTLTTVSPASTAPAATVFDDTLPLPVNAISALNTELLPSHVTSRRGFVPVLLGLILLLSLGSGLVLAYFGLPVNFSRQRKSSQQTTAASSPIDRPSPGSASPAPQAPVFSPLSSFNKGALIRTKSEIVLSHIALRQNKAMPAAQTSSSASQPQQRFSSIKGIVPSGSVLQVLDKQLVSEQEDYSLLLKVCSTPSTQQSNATKLEPDNKDASPKTGNIQPSPTASNSKMDATDSRLLQPGDEGQIQEATIEPLILSTSSVKAELGNCPTSTPSSTSLSEPNTPVSPSPQKLPGNASREKTVTEPNSKRNSANTQ